jgi:hypothetical protein
MRSLPPCIRGRPWSGLNEDLVSKDEVLVKASLARDEPTGGQLTSKPKSCPCQAAPALDCRKSAEP